MPSYSNSIETETIHDWKPSHPKRSQAEQTARLVESIAWDASDWLLERAHEERDPDEKDIFYDAHARMQFAAEVAGESLRTIQHQILPILP